MKLLLDTHIFLWAISTPQRLSQDQRKHIESLTSTIYLSSISIAEIMIKASIGKLQIDFDPAEEARNAGFDQLPFSQLDAFHLKDLPFHHRDPFDRMLLAQGLQRQLPIMTQDSAFSHYPCKIIT